MSDRDDRAVMKPISGARPVRPISIGRFTLTQTGLEVKGRPTFENYEGVGDFIKRTHQASGWWLVDWIAYGEGRDDWKEKLSQLIDAGTLSRRSVDQYRYIGKHVAKEDRRDDVPFAQHAEVASLPAPEQRKWLKRAADEELSAGEVRKGVRAEKRVKVIDAQAVLKGMYRVIYADPAWDYNSSSGADSGAFKTAAEHYPTMTIAEMCKLPVAAHAMKDAVLFMWVTSPLLAECWPVIEAWGFKYKSSMVWDKVLGNFGHYVRVHHEYLLICTRGSCLPDEPTPMPDSVQVIRRSDVHSEKPEEFRGIITKLYTRGPYLELFGRKKVEGWDVFGNDARLWSEEVGE
jgi:N6-adenosine-specific RNA methylase IME4